MHSTPKLLEVMVTQECHKADIDWYMRKPTDPPQVHLIVGKLLELCKEEDAILGPNLPHETVSFHIEMGRNVCWNLSDTMLCQPNSICGRQVWKEIKMMLYDLDYINKLLQYYYPTARQLPCQITEKPFYTTLGQWIELLLVGNTNPVNSG